MSEATEDVEQAVEERYSKAATVREPSLCCPVSYDPKLLEAIPREVLETRVLLTWFDVDRIADLALLRTLVDRGEIDAPETARVLDATPEFSRWRRAGAACA